MTVISRLGISAASLAGGFCLGGWLSGHSAEHETRQRSVGAAPPALAASHETAAAHSETSASSSSEKVYTAYTAWDEARAVLSRASAEGKEPEGDAFSTACSEIGRRSGEETLAWYQHFVQLGRYGWAQKVFHSIHGSTQCAEVDYGELAVPMLPVCSSENINLLAFIAGKQVQRDPHDFPEWAQKIPDEFKIPVLDSIIDFADFSEPAARGIENLLKELPDSPERDRLYTRVWEGLFDNNPERTFEMAVNAVAANALEADGPPLSALAEKWRREDPHGLLIRLESLAPASLDKVFERLAVDNPKLLEQLKADLAAP